MRGGTALSRRPAVAVAASLAFLCSCGGGGSSSDTGPVAISAPPAPAEALTACAELVKTLPVSLGDGLDRREIDGDVARGAAWGDPPVVLTCGVAAAGQPGVDGEPVFLATPDGQKLEFLVDDVGAASLWLTVGRTVTVSLTIPDAYDSQAVQPLVLALFTALPLAAPGS